MAKVRRGIAQKAAMVEKISERMKRSQALILTDFRGLNVASMTRLRRRLKEVGAEYLVAKNTLIRRAVHPLGTNGAFGTLLEGPTALCFAYQDPTVVVKALAEFARENPNLKMKGGWLGGRVLSAQEVNMLADLPPREVLLARVLGGMQAPISSLLFVLNGTVRQLVLTLEAIRKQKEEAAAQPAPAAT